MLDPRDAWRRLTPHLAPLPPESLPRRRAAGRVLAEPLRAVADLPAADVSAMDGYALAGGAPGDVLPVSGRVVAGDPPGAALPAGGALRIMTGAPLPAGADRVVPIEDTDGGRERVRLDAVPAAGANVRRRGEIVAAGAPLLPAGTPLTAGALSLLAAHGIAEVAVRRAPRVALLVTGDELVPPDAEPGPGRLRDSHSDFLLAALAGIGLGLEPLGIASDRREELSARLAAGLATADVLLITGGVSKGERDLVGEVLAELGCRPLFAGVAIQPGKPLAVFAGPAQGTGERGAEEERARGAPVASDGGEGRPRLVFGLPGNPGAVMTCYWLFVRPALRRLMGHRDGWLHGLAGGELIAPAPGAKQRHLFVTAEVEAEGGRVGVRPVPQRGSHDLAASARGTALLWIAPGSPPRKAGEPCSFLPIG